MITPQAYNFISPLFKKRWGVLVLVLALFWVYGIPILKDGKSLINAKWLDIAISHWLSAPMASAVHRAFAAGEFPFWNPFNGVGAPLAADLQNAFFSPFHWLAFLIPSYRTWDSILLLRLLVTGSGVMMFLHACRVRYWIGVYIALLYMFSGHLYYFGNAWHINTLALTPWFLYGIQQCFNNNTKTATLAVTLSWCFMITGGGLLEVVLAGLLFAIILLLHARTSTESGNYHAKAAYLMFLILLGTVMAAILLVPFLELKSLSAPPWGGRSHKVFNSWPYFLSLFFHKITVTPPDASHYYMKFRQFLNILILPGLVWSLLYLRNGSSRQKRWFIVFWVFVGIYFGKLYGVPFLQFLNNVPLIQYVRFEKYVGTAYLALYLLAGLGYEWLLRDDATNKYKLIISTLFLAILPISYLAMYGVMSNWALKYAVTCGLVILLTASLLYWHSKTINRGAIFLIFCICLYSVQLDLQKGYLRDNYYKEMPPDIHKLLVRETTNPPVRIFYNKQLPPKMLLTYGLSDIRDFADPMQQRYFTLFKKHALKRKTWNYFVLVSEKYRTWNHDILSFLNVGYFVVGNSPVPSHVKTEEPAVFFNPEVFPRAFMVYDIEYMKSGRKILKSIVSNPLLFRKKAIIESANSSGMETKKGPAIEPVWDVVFLNYGFNTVELEIKTSHRGLLVLADQYYPGWEVQINGKKSEIQQVDYLFRGVWLDKGVSKVSFIYRPLSFKIGLLLTLLAVVVVILLSRENAQVKIRKILAIKNSQ